jgi:hypothetical protein
MMYSIILNLFQNYKNEERNYNNVVPFFFDERFRLFLTKFWNTFAMDNTNKFQWKTIKK